MDTVVTIFTVYWCLKALENAFSKKKALEVTPSNIVNIDVVLMSKLKSPSVPAAASPS